jgi:diguanylate cyclase (GGDEF)-like protein
MYRQLRHFRQGVAMRAITGRAPGRAAIGQWPIWEHWPIWELPRWLRLFVIGVVVADAGALAGALAAAFAGTGSLRPHDLETFAILLGFGIATIELTRRHGEPAGLIKDLHAVWYLPAALLLPPLYALLAPIPVVLLSQVRLRRALVYRRVFTAAAIGLSLGAASVVFHAVMHPAGASLAGSSASQLRWAALAAGCGALRTLINKILIVIAIKGSEPAASLRQLAWDREVIYNDVAELCLSVVMGFAVGHVAFMIVFALPFVTLLQRSFRHAQLAGQARIDAKTGLLNAATWQREAHTEVTRAVRTGMPLAVAMIDIDHFKNVNDTYGHLAGDAVLASISAAMRGMLREYDLVGRFGGEEFTILLPHTLSSEAGDIAERLREKLAMIVTPVTDATSTTCWRRPTPPSTGPSSPAGTRPAWCPTRPVRPRDRYPLTVIR